MRTSTSPLVAMGPSWLTSTQVLVPLLHPEVTPRPRPDLPIPSGSLKPKLRLSAPSYQASMKTTAVPEGTLKLNVRGPEATLPPACILSPPSLPAATTTALPGLPGPVSSSIAWETRSLPSWGPMWPPRLMLIT
jgi:hypothetical protein